MSRQRPLPKRFKQDIYISNETFYGSGEYIEPFVLQGIVASKAQNLIVDSGTNITQYNNIVTFEYDVANGKGITDNSHFWIRRIPNEEQNGADFTHTVRGTDIKPNNQYMEIELRGVAGNTPII